MINRYNLDSISEDKIYYVADSQYYVVRECNVKKRNTAPPICTWVDLESNEINSRVLTFNSQIFETRREAVEFLTYMLNKKIEKETKLIKKLEAKKKKLENEN